MFTVEMHVIQLPKHFYPYYMVHDTFHKLFTSILSEMTPALHITQPHN